MNLEMAIWGKERNRYFTCFQFDSECPDGLIYESMPKLRQNV